MRNEFEAKKLTVLMNLKAKEVSEKAYLDSYANNVLNLLGSRTQAAAASVAKAAFIADLDAMILEFQTNGNG